jgi:tetratricopeptide (TPR) repeat protein
MDELLHQGITAYKAGKRDEARKIFITVVKQSPDSEPAWGWLYQASNNNQERIHCLRQVTRINPQNSSANKLLSDLEKSQKPKNPPSASPHPHVTTTSTTLSQLTSSNQGTLILGLGSIIAILLCVIVYLVFRPSTQKQTKNNPQPVSSNPIGTILVNSWRFEILEIQSDPGKDSSRQIVVLIGNMYNEGRTTDTFVPLYKIVLRDSAGREYGDDYQATNAAEDKYGAIGAAYVNPGAYAYVAYAYDVPSSEHYFVIIPGSLAVSWGGNWSFNVP